MYTVAGLNLAIVYVPVYIGFSSPALIGYAWASSDFHISSPTAVIKNEDNRDIIKALLYEIDAIARLFAIPTFVFNFECCNWRIAVGNPFQLESVIFISFRIGFDVCKLG